jgi:hypothetical protein
MRYQFSQAKSPILASSKRCAGCQKTPRGDANDPSIPTMTGSWGPPLQALLGRGGAVPSGRPFLFVEWELEEEWRVDVRLLGLFEWFGRRRVPCVREQGTAGECGCGEDCEKSGARA